MSTKDDEVVAQALKILKRRARKGTSLENPDKVRDYLTVQLSPYEHEVFQVVFLDNRHRVIEINEMFRGTIDGATVHPREIVKAALSHNAAAVIFSHNHPSGVAEPSRSDINLTKRLVEALGLVDVRVLDHFVISGGHYISFAERGLI